MKKTILHIGKTLNKKEQKNINGGMFGGFNCPSTPICYGISDTTFPGPCGSCAQWNALPQDCKNRVLVHTNCTAGQQAN